MLMIILVLIILGLGLGSFVNALVWRLHEQMKGKKSKDLSIIKGRSMCPHCKHQLQATDLIPLFSWLFLRGKCRYCGKSIGWQYPLVELMTALVFVGSYLFWSYGFSGFGVVQFGIWLVCVIVFMALIVYDLRWMILPDRLVAVIGGLAGVQAIILAITNKDAGSVVMAVLSVLCTAGFFWVLFQLSDGKWIGGGDVKLAVGLGLLLATPLAAMLMLFLASLGGSVVSVPLLIKGKAGRNTKIPFGPFLIAATMAVYIFGADIISWYESLLFAV